MSKLALNSFSKRTWISLAAIVLVFSAGLGFSYFTRHRSGASLVAVPTNPLTSGVYGTVTLANGQPGSGTLSFTPETPAGGTAYSSNLSSDGNFLFTNLPGPVTGTLSLMGDDGFSYYIPNGEDQSFTLSPGQQIEFSGWMPGQRLLTDKQVGNTVVPTIAVQPPTVAANTPISFPFTVADGGINDSFLGVAMYYRMSPTTAWTLADLSNSDANHYTASLPAMAASSTLQYYVTASDPQGNRGYYPANVGGNSPASLNAPGPTASPISLDPITVSFVSPSGNSTFNTGISNTVTITAKESAYNTSVLSKAVLSYTTWKGIGTSWTAYQTLGTINFPASCVKSVPCQLSFTIPANAITPARASYLTLAVRVYDKSNATAAATLMLTPANAGGTVTPSPSPSPSPTPTPGSASPTVSINSPGTNNTFHTGTSNAVTITAAASVVGLSRAVLAYSLYKGSAWTAYTTLNTTNFGTNCTRGVSCNMSFTVPGNAISPAGATSLALAVKVYDMMGNSTSVSVTVVPSN